METERFSEAQLRSDFATKHYEIIAGSCMKLWELRWNYIQLSLFGICAFYAAIFSSSLQIFRSEVIYWLIWVPPLISVFGLIHAVAIRRGIKDRNKILLSIEEMYGLFGWAHRYDQLGREKRPYYFALLTYCYWAVIIIGTAALAFAVMLGGLTLEQAGG